VAQRRVVFWIAVCVACVGATVVAQEQKAALPLTPDQVLAHLNQTISWYRRIASIEQLPVEADDVVRRDKLHQTSVTALRLAFDFARAAAALLNSGAQPANAPEATGTAGELDQAAARLAQRVASLESQLKDLDAQLAHAPPRLRETLVARRAEVAAALNLAKEVQSTVQDIEEFEEASMSGGAGGQGGLAAQIAELQRSFPEARHVTTSAAHGSAAAGTTGPSGGPAAGGSSTRAAATPVPVVFRPETAGIIALVTEWLTLRDMRLQLDGGLKETDSLIKELDTLRGGFTAETRNLIRADVTATAATDPTQLAAARQTLEAALMRFKQLSTVLVPLGEQAITVQSARTTLSEWRNALLGRSSTVVRYLMLRTLILLASIGLVLGVSEIWRRATFRYLHDARRRRQFLTLRRIVVGFALTLIIVFGFVSEMGSVATYAGFVTAGIAVALQNVILAIVAYFFLIGRYGVRVGDRVTMAGVTGRVVDIALIRIYLMELSGPDLHSTGRIVVLSNAVLFQPAALFKQIPGVDYVWHTVTLTLAPTVDVQMAEARLRAAAESVYHQYRSEIEQQHAVAQRFVDFDTSVPRPEVYVRLTESGLECTVRYPVLPEQAAATDQRMVKALRDALAESPQLPLVSSGQPALASSSGS
jgi:small-conductance mechanosensitive channel